MSDEKITPPEIIETRESALSEPPAEPHQHFTEAGAPDGVDVPQHLPRDLDVPLSNRTLINAHRRVIE